MARVESKKALLTLMKTLFDVRTMTHDMPDYSFEVISVRQSL